jgi:hypothetical protein
LGHCGNRCAERNRIMPVNVSPVSGSSVWASELRPGVFHCGRVPARRIRSFRHAGHRRIALVNLIGRLAVQVGDERRRHRRDARRCRRTRADVVMKTAMGMPQSTHPTPGVRANVFMSVFLRKYARGSQLALRQS